MTNLKTFKHSDSQDKIIEALKKDGCVVIEDILTSENLCNLKHELASHLQEQEHCQGDFYGYKTKRLSGLVAKSSEARDLITNELILKLMDSALLEHCDQYQLNLTQAISIGPYEPQQIIHRDDAMFPFAKNGSEAMVNCMYAITDFTKENGATHLVPGSHKWDPERLPEEHEIVQGEMKAGSVLVYLGSLIHGGGSNTTHDYRTGMVLSYCCGWLRQAENHYLAVPIEFARSLPTKLQQLLGYFVHKPNLGSIEGRDPIELLTNTDINGLKGAEFREYIPDEVKPMIREFRDKQGKAA